MSEAQMAEMKIGDTGIVDGVLGSRSIMAAIFSYRLGSNEISMSRITIRLRQSRNSRLKISRNQPWHKAWEEAVGPEIATKCQEHHMALHSMRLCRHHENWWPGGRKPLFVGLPCSHYTKFLVERLNDISIASFTIHAHDCVIFADITASQCPSTSSSLPVTGSLTVIDP